jgi:acetylornithine aminotransferase
VILESNILQLYEISDKNIVSGKECTITDSDGRVYVDFEAGDWAAILGHSNRKVNGAITNQISKIIHDGLRFKNIPSEKLADRLLELLGFNNGKCVFLNSGSEAVNLAIILAMNITGRKKCLKIDCTYLSAYGYGRIADDNECLVNIPIDRIDLFQDIDFDKIAAFVFEPGNSRGLIRFPSREFISALTKEVKNHNGILISNEVTTGFGRTGKWFGYNHYDYKPDIVAMGKALGNGYPISCVATNEQIVREFSKAPFRYAQSHQNDPLGCAIGIEVIEAIKEMDLINRCANIGNVFHAQLTNLMYSYQTYIKDIRSRGLMLALEFDSQISSNSIASILMDKGYLVGCRDNVLRFMPPLIIEEEQIRNLVELIEDAFCLTTIKRKIN